MPSLIHDFPHTLVAVITNAVSTFLLIIVFILLQYTFNMQYVCLCIPGSHQNSILYILLPPVILVWFVFVTEPIHRRRIFSRWSCHGCNSCLLKLFQLFLDYLGLVVVWCAAVLFDGDWYVCLQTNLNSVETGIPCKKNRTDLEDKITAGHKTASLNYGLIAISSLLAFWILAELITASCTRNRTWRKICPSKLERPPYYRMVYEDILKEQVSCHLSDELTTIAREKATVICEPMLSVIRDHELTLSNSEATYFNEDESLETWWRISASDFYLTEPDQSRDKTWSWSFWLRQPRRTT